MNSDHDKAIDKFEFCIAENTNGDAVYYALHKSYNVLGNLGKSQENIAKAYEIDPENFSYVNGLAKTLHAQGKFEEAAKILLKAKKIWPEKKSLFYDAAFNFSKAKKHNEAIKVIEELESYQGVSPEITLYKYSIFSEANNAEKAIKTLEQGNASFPNHPGILSYMVDFYMNRQEIDKGILLLKELSAADPYNSNAAVYLGDFLLEKKDSSEAFSYYKTALRGNQLDAKTTADLFVAMKSIWKQDAELFDLVKNANQLFDNDPLLLSILGDFHMMYENQLEALSKYQMVVKINPDLQVVWEEIMAIEYELEQWDSLKKDAHSFNELFPFSPIGHYAEAIALLENDELEGAERILEKGVDIIIKDKLIGQELTFLLGELKIRSGKLEEGKKKIQQVMDEIPNNVFVLSRYFTLAIDYFEDIALAKEIKTRLQEISTELDFIIVEIKLLIAQKKFNEALDLIEKKPMHNEHYRILELKGDIYLLQKKKDKALEQWRMSLSKGNHSDRLKSKLSPTEK